MPSRLAAALKAPSSASRPSTSSSTPASPSPGPKKASDSSMDVCPRTGLSSYVAHAKFYLSRHSYWFCKLRIIGLRYAGRPSIPPSLASASGLKLSLLLENANLVLLLFVAFLMRLPYGRGLVPSGRLAPGATPWPEAVARGTFGWNAVGVAWAAACALGSASASLTRKNAIAGVVFAQSGLASKLDGLRSFFKQLVKRKCKNKNSMQNVFVIGPMSLIMFSHKVAQEVGSVSCFQAACIRQHADTDLHQQAWQAWHNPSCTDVVLRRPEEDRNLLRGSVPQISDWLRIWRAVKSTTCSLRALEQLSKTDSGLHVWYKYIQAGHPSFYQVMHCFEFHTVGRPSLLRFPGHLRLPATGACRSYQGCISQHGLRLRGCSSCAQVGSPSLCRLRLCFGGRQETLVFHSNEV